MRIKPKEWKFYDSCVLTIWSFERLNDTEANIKGAGEVFDDKVRVDDTIIMRAKGNKYVELLIKEIEFTSITFEAKVEILNIK